jgi:hypothetical protein
MRDFVWTTHRERPGAEHLARGPSPDELPGVELTGSSNDIMVHRKASCACGGGCPSCSAKSTNLPVSRPEDAGEREADHMADKVMRSASPDQTSPLQKKDSIVPGALPSTLGLGPGGSLDENTRSFMESRFSRDFSGVRIHNDARAAESARSFDAEAYTYGNNIVFDSGRYNPGSESGKRLLAHELAHVTQQNHGIQRYRNKKGAIHYGTDEEAFNKKKDKETKPWIELVTVTFSSTTTDTDGTEYWVGSGVAKYYKDKLPPITLNLSGGPKKHGKTKKGTFTVKRIEGVGYMSSSYSDPYVRESNKGWGRRYAQDLRGNMNYAVFFYGAQALHSGPADLSSHGCVHVDWTDESNMKQVNYHSVIGLTKVKVDYP